MEMRRLALEEERRRREDLEKRLQEETNRRQRLIEREVKLREKQRSQVHLSVPNTNPTISYPTVLQIGGTIV